MKTVAKKISTGHKRYSVGKHCVDKKKGDDSSVDEQKVLPPRKYSAQLGSWDESDG